MVLLGLLIFQWWNWHTMSTDNFTIIYKAGYHWEAQQVLNNLEYYRPCVVELTGNDVERIPIVIEDAGLTSNGFANPALHTVNIYTNPGGMVTSLEGLEDWYRLVSVHEYTHMAHLTRTGGLPKYLSTLFGFPFQMNMYAPAWIYEGITVYSESQPSLYEGRLNDGFFDAYIAARAGNSSFPSIIEATNSPNSFPQGTYYMYGGKFFDFLAHQYGEKRFADFFDRYGSSILAPLSAALPWINLDRAARRVYGKSLPGLFDEWRAFEEARCPSWEQDGERLTNKGWYMSSLLQAGQKLYYARVKTIKVDAFRTQIVREIIEFDIPSKEERTIVRLNAAVASPMKVHNGCLFFTTYDIKNAANVSQRGYGFTASLHRMNIATGKDTILFNDDIRSFCVLKDGSLLYSKDLMHCFGAELWHYDGQARMNIRDVPYLINEMVEDSQDIIVVARKNGENWNILRMGDQFEPLVSSPWVEGSIAITNNVLLFTANYEGQYSNYVINFKDDRIYRLTGQGFSYNPVIVDDTLYYIGLSTEGFDVYRKPLAGEETAIEPCRSSRKIPAPSVPFTQGGYWEVCKTIFPTARVPFFYPADTTFTRWVYGVMLYGGDATGENTYDAYIAYDHAARSPVIQGSLNSFFFAPVTAALLFEYDESVSGALSYPMFQTTRPGVSRMYCFAVYNAFDNFQRKEIIPGVRMDITYPLTRMSLILSMPVERTDWKSAINRIAAQLHTELSQLLGNGELRLKNLFFDDREEPDTPSISIRGDTSITAQRGVRCTVEYSHQLFSLRWGLWNPNIYFEDIFGTVFFDYAINHNGEYIYSAGVELKVETKIAFGACELIPVIGGAVTNNGRLRPYARVSTDFVFR